MPTLTINTPTGPFQVTETDGAITGAEWRPGPRQRSALLDRAAAEINAYFAGDLTRFTVPWHVAGSAFQRAVCDAIFDIPFGDTRTYGAIAKDLSAPPQAIGQACGGNPIPLIVPCHRVLAAGTLGGFSGSGGVETKVALLKHEGAASLLI